MSLWFDRSYVLEFFFFQAEDGIRDIGVTGVQTCALPILRLPPVAAPAPLPPPGGARGARPLAVRIRGPPVLALTVARHERGRSEERRVGKECRSRWSPYH